MNKRREISNIEFFGNLVLLAGLIVSLAFFPQTRSEAKKNGELSEPAPETQSENKPADYGRLPLLFEENKGQTDRAAKFIMRGAGYTLFLTRREAVFSLKIEQPADGSAAETRRSKTAADILRLKFAGAMASPQLSGETEMATKTNYYLGKKRVENVPNFQKVNYRNLYRGIDAVFYANAENELEYDFLIAPHADPRQIGLGFDGAKSLSLDESENLVVETQNARLVQQKPVAYQIVEGDRREVPARYVIDAQSQVRFALGEYDPAQPLVIDPVLNYLTYLGGSLIDRADSIKADRAGNAFVVGATESLDFPAPNSRVSDDAAIFVAKISADGRSLLFNTFLDGSEPDGLPSINGGDFLKNDLALDAAGNVYVAGVTESDDFPVTGNAFQQSYGCTRQFGVCVTPEEAFVTKLNAQGTIVYSTFLGGRDNDFASGIAVDAAGRAYVAGGTFSALLFPTKNQYQGTGVYAGSQDAFLTVFNASGSDIVYSTGFGGRDTDMALDVGLDAAGNAYIVGETTSAGTFPTKNAFQSANGGGRDAFVAKFNALSSGEDSLLYSTFLGGSGTERANAIAVAANGTTVVAGVTGSFNFPLKNAFDSTNQINEAFVAQYNAAGAMTNSSFLGGSDQDEGVDVALGNTGTIYLTGSTLSNDFPLALPFQATRRGLRDAFVAKIRFGANNNPGVSAASYLGGSLAEIGRGIAVRGNFIYLCGVTESNNLATTGGVLKQTTNAAADSEDGFVAKILDARRETVGTFDPSNTVFKLRNALTSGAPDLTIDRGAAGDVQVAGDFNGDGTDTVSTFNNGVWKIQNFNAIVAGYPAGAITVNFGAAGDLPVVGDWNDDGVETLGVYRPSAGQFFLSNLPVTTASDPTPNVDVTVTFGIAEDLPVAGDWNADGTDSIGVFRPSAGQFFLTDANVLAPGIDQVFNFGTAGDLPVAGDWDGNGVETVGVWRASTTEFFLTNNNINISHQFAFGAANERPVAGDWDGRP